MKFFVLVYDSVILWFNAQKKEEINVRDEEEITLREIQEQKEYQKKLEATEDYKLKKLLEWVEATQYTVKENILFEKSKLIFLFFPRPSILFSVGFIFGE